MSDATDYANAVAFLVVEHPNIQVEVIATQCAAKHAGRPLALRLKILRKWIDNAEAEHLHVRPDEPLPLDPPVHYGSRCDESYNAFRAAIDDARQAGNLSHAQVADLIEPHIGKFADLPAHFKHFESIGDMLDLEVRILRAFPTDPLTASQVLLDAMRPLDSRHPRYFPKGTFPDLEAP